MSKSRVRASLLPLLLGTLLVGVDPTARNAAADDAMDALETAFQEQIAAFNNGNLEAAIAAAHPDIVLYGIFSPFPVQGKSDFQKSVQAYFGQYEEAELSPVTPQFRIVGTTGLAWGHYQLAAVPQGEKLTYAHGRYLFAYAKVDGKWLVLGMDFSPLESYRFAP